MIALYIILGIILFFILILSIRAHIHVEYEDEITAYAKWAFLKIPLLPRPDKPKKEKKPKKEPEKKPEEEKPQEEKPKGPNPIVTLYNNEKIEGILDIINRLLNLINKFGHRLAKSFVIDEMFLDITVSRSDAAQTAEEYGKMCYRVFPVMGALCANCNVKKYSINIDPDYIGKGYNEFAFSAEISLNPRKLINAVLLFAFGAVFKLLFRLLKGIKPPNTEKGDKSKNPETETESPAENSNAEVPQTEGIPHKKIEYGKYDEGTVHEPEIYSDNNLNDNNKESGA